MPAASKTVDSPVTVQLDFKYPISRIERLLLCAIIHGTKSGKVFFCIAKTEDHLSKLTMCQFFGRKRSGTSINAIRTLISSLERDAHVDRVTVYDTCYVSADTLFLQAQRVGDLTRFRSASQKPAHHHFERREDSRFGANARAEGRGQQNDARSHRTSSMMFLQGPGWAGAGGKFTLAFFYLL